jgi:hypothetical protein
MGLRTLEIVAWDPGPALRSDPGSRISPLQGSKAHARALNELRKSAKLFGSAVIGLS